MDRIRQHGVIEQHGTQLLIGQTRYAFAEIGLAIVLVLELPGDVSPVQICAAVEPCSGQNRRNVGRFINVGCRQNLITDAECAKLLGVPLLNHSKTAKLALCAIEVTVVVSVVCCKTVPTDPVANLHPFNYMHRERYPGDPGFPSFPVLYVEFG